MTPKAIAAAKQEFLQRIAQISKASGSTSPEEAATTDATSLATFAAKYTLKEDWWSIWTIQNDLEPEQLGLSIAQKRYGSDETKVDPYATAFKRAWKKVEDSIEENYNAKESGVLKFFLDQPLAVWRAYYGKEVTYRERFIKKELPEDYDQRSVLDDGSWDRDPTPQARWHNWTTNRFDIMAHSYAGKVDYVRFAPLTGKRVILSDELDAIAKSLGLQTNGTGMLNVDLKNDHVFLHYLDPEGYEAGTQEYLSRSINDQ
jgi:hypothetical protein